MGRLIGKTAIITGGGSGIGLAVAERFLAEGANIVVMDRDAARVAALNARGLTALLAVSGDVCSLDDNGAAVTGAVQRFGALDICVPNAGVWDWNARLVDIPASAAAAAFDEVFDVNVKGAFLMAHAAARALVESGGTLIFTLSNAALYTNGGGPLYTASKHATLGLMRQLAYELAPRVRVNGVAIGGAATDLRGIPALGQADMSISAVPIGAAAALATPLARPQTVAALAGSYVFLADAQDSGALTGAVIEAHGGMGVRGVVKPAGGYDLDPDGDPTAAALAEFEQKMRKD